MRTAFRCPICDAERWRDAGAHRYRVTEHADADPGLDAYARLRRRVLFEVWYPGRDEVALTVRACECCGLVCFAPRPDAADIDAKYRFLAQTEIDVGGSEASPIGRQTDRRRGRETAAELGPHLPTVADILDLGGGDGKLLAPLLADGHRGHLFDYNPRPLPGVRRAGDTLVDLSDDERFDAIIASHVLEHVADPRGLLLALAARLRPAGVLFAEVPLEVWRGIRIAREPVTHVNFFTVPTLAASAVAAGLEVITVRELTGSYDATVKPVARLLARTGSDSRFERIGDPGLSLRLLEPSLPARIDRALRRRVGEHAWRWRR